MATAKEKADLVLHPNPPLAVPVEIDQTHQPPIVQVVYQPSAANPTARYGRGVECCYPVGAPLLPVVALGVRTLTCNVEPPAEPGVYINGCDLYGCDTHQETSSSQSANEFVRHIPTICIHTAL